MRRVALVLMLALAASLFVACGAKEKLDKAAISEDLKDKGTTELLEETSDDTYDAPADQRLTEAQIQMYLKVREKEKVIAQVAMQELKQNAEKAKEKGDKSLTGMMDSFKALGSAADVLTADIRAAAELGYNTAEYKWVKDKVLEASGAAMGEQMAAATNKMYDASYNQLKQQHDAATDEQQKKALADMLASMEQGRKEMTQPDVEPHVAYNKQLLSKHENALNALATEWSKFEEKPGDAEKAMKEGVEQWQKAAEGMEKGQQ